MNILIVGANGKIGKILSRQLVEDEELSPVAMIRKEEQAEYFEGIGADYTMGDLQSSIDELADLFEGADAIVFTAGSGGKTGYDKTLEIDLDGAVKTMEAAKKAGVSRYVMVSAIGADDREYWNSSPIKPYMIAKSYADRELRKSGLDYTILQPGRLTDEEGTCKITTDVKNADTREIPREDVASAIVSCLRDENTIGKTISMLSGEVSITDALKAV